ncbi:MAG: SPFH domain-containing protein [Solobacterium sp.]|nr:SPFH domain-containing protein [Solobacterium sp.]
MKPIFDVIKFEGGNHQLVWKHPGEDFSTHSTLIVNPNQIALFYKNGTIADIFKEGRYVLSTENIPILRKIIELPTAGVSSFTSQVYYVNLVEAMDVKWGLPSRSSWMDPVYGIPVTVGARGNMSLKVEDPAAVVLNLVGAETGLTAEELQRYFRDLITMRVKAYLAQVCQANRIDVFSMTAQQELIAEELKKKLVQDFLEYGFKLRMFTISDFILPEDDPAYMRLKRAISERTTGITEAQTDRMKANIAAQASAESEVIRSQGRAASLNNLGTNHVLERQLDIAETMASNENMNQFSGMAGSMAMMGGALNMGAQAAGVIGSAMNGAGMNNMAGNPYLNTANPYMTQPQAPVQQTPVQNQNGSAETKACIKCGASLPKYAKFCMECGTVQPKLCRGCGAVLPDGAKFCMECGTKAE